MGAMLSKPGTKPDASRVNAYNNASRSEVLMSLLPVPSRISRIEAFAEQGVSLAYPPRSWSGVREDDGGVVIAIRDGEIHAAVDGLRCLLWSPVIEGATEWVDRPMKEERLSHCRL